MSTKKPKHRHAPSPTSEETRSSGLSNTALFGLAALLGGLLGYAGWQYYNRDPFSLPAATKPSPVETPPASTSTAATPAKPADMQKLRGRWVRTDSDGNYILNIKNVAEDGKLEAEYLNPRPIHIAKAEAKIVEGRLRVFVEFRDVNYPGSTYDLRYDAASEQLVGEYYQATQQQVFQVSFERTK